MISHSTGTFPVCKYCGQEPKHYVATGRCRTDPILVGAIGERHVLECFCQGAEQRTALHPRLTEAMREWRDFYSVLSLSLHRRARQAA
jgi:hypothetical protein